MASRQGGKLKPLKVWTYRPRVALRLTHSQTAKKEKKELDEDDIAFKDKKKAEEAALKAAREKGE